MPKRIEHRFENNIEYKRCSSCKNWFILECFYKSKHSWDGLYQKCKVCDKKLYDIRYEKNKELISVKGKIYYKNNRETVNGRNKKYKEANIETVKEYKSNWQKENKKERNKRLRERYNNEPNYRLAVLLRTRIQKALDNNQKSGHTLELLGCTVDEFKLYLEKMFYSDMSWENHGIVWHIDHIKPCSKFNLSDEKELRMCFHFSNMQPLLVNENLVKGNRI